MSGVVETKIIHLDCPMSPEDVYKIHGILEEKKILKLEDDTTYSICPGISLKTDFSNNMVKIELDVSS